MRPRLILFIPGFLWFILIFVLLILPGSDIPEVHFLDGIYFDKWVHIGLFAGLVFLFSFPFKKYAYHRNRVYINIAIGSFIYGVAMEFVQKYFASQRSFDFTDMLADGVGCLLGYAFIQYQLARRLRKAENK